MFYFLWPGGRAGYATESLALVPLIWPSAAQALTAAAAAASTTAVAPLSWDPSAHLVNRFGFGVTPADRAYLAAHSPDAWWNQQVALGKAQPGYTAVPAVAAIAPLLSQRPNQLQAYFTAEGKAYSWDAMDQLTCVTLGLQVWSPAQLFESIVDFFGNHFNVPNHNGDLFNTRHLTDRDAIRPNALGTFTDMLLAVARDPAMMMILNNAESTVEGINENYGRELLELHTVGIGAGYTQAMVVDSARILTGRTVSEYWDYVYDAMAHYTGPVSVLGFSAQNASASAGEALGDSYLRYLASHPSTAMNLARKLCVHYVSDSPSDALVQAVAASYLSNGTSIPATLYTILCSTEFWAARGAKVRKPTENIIATLRTLGTTYDPATLRSGLDSLRWLTGATGNTPLEWLAPNGYPDVAAAWRSSGTLLNLWGSHRGFTQNWFTGLKSPATTTFYGSVAPTTSGQAIDLVCRRLVGRVFTPDHKQALQDFVGEPANTALSRSKLAWMLDQVVPLVLDSPYHALR